MSTTTPRNAMVKPGYADAADIAVLNTNYDTIDAAIAKGNYAAAVAPTANDDSGDGYAPGSVWIDTTAHNVYVCEVATLTAAVWKQVNTAAISGYVKQDGSLPLTANWDVGTYKITANQLESDVATGTAPLVIASTTVVSNLHAANSDALNGIADTGFVKQTLADAKGDLLVASANDTWARQAIAATDGKCLVVDSSEANGVSWQRMYSGRQGNVILNPEFAVNQTGITQYTATTNPANSDDTYLFDQWTLLSDGNDIMDVWQSSAAVPSALYGTGYSHSVLLQTETANKKAGIIQFIEATEARPIIGGPVSLRFQAYTLSAYPNANIMAAVLSWSSTADTVTSDVVSSWEATGTAPTLAANWTYENVPARLALVNDTWTEYKIENISIDTASTTNIAVFIWLDDTNSTVDDRLYITGVQLNAGETCIPYSCPNYAVQLAQCKRFQMIWNSDGAVYGHVGTATANDTEYAYVEWPHSTNWWKTSAAMTLTGTLALFDSVDTESLIPSIVIRVRDTAKGLTGGHSYIVYANNDATMRITGTSRL